MIDAFAPLACQLVAEVAIAKPSTCRRRAFGLTTAANYALSGLIDGLIAAEFIVGGFIGGHIGMRLACRLSNRKTALNRIFAGLVCLVALYMLYKNAAVFHLV